MDALPGVWRRYPRWQAVLQGLRRVIGRVVLIVRRRASSLAADYLLTAERQPEPRRLQRPPPTAADGTVAAAPQATLDAALGSHISAPSTELRHVSVLLCDLVDFTPFSEKHDITPPSSRARG